MLTDLPVKLGGTAALLLIAGIFFGSFTPMYMGVFICVFLVFSLTIEQPKEIDVKTQLSKVDAGINEVVQATSKIKVGRGVGPVTVFCELPSHFSLVEGSNIATVWKGKEVLETSMKFSFRCTKRGVYQVCKTSWASKHPLSMFTSKNGVAAESTFLVIRPPHYVSKRVRDKRILTRMPMPSEARIVVGVQTTEFKEIRDYKVGDAYRSINWKATARLRSSPGEVPLVNEFEREGRRVVWVLLNTAPNMSLGNDLQNCFEYGVRAVLEIAEYYLSRQCLVGLSLYNDGLDTGNEALSFLYTRRGKRSESAGSIRDDKGFDRPSQTSEMLYPDSGNGQYQKIARNLLKANVGSSRSTFNEALKKAKTHHVGGHPLYYIVTVVDEKNEDLLIHSLRGLGERITRRIGSTPAIILHISNIDVHSNSSARLRSSEVNLMLNRVRGTGASVVNWNPASQSFTNALRSQVRR